MLDMQDSYCDEMLIFYIFNGMDFEVVECCKLECFFNFSDCVMLILIGYMCIQDGEIIVFGGWIWDIRIGDGYVVEYVMFWLKDDNFVFGGDQLLLLISLNIGVYVIELEVDFVVEWLVLCEWFLVLVD